MSKLMRIDALRITQGTDQEVFVFGLSADELLEISDISRISRNSNGRVIGYQRAIAKQHVKNIVEYLNGESPLFPNAIILALDSRVRFEARRGPRHGNQMVEPGYLHIPMPGGDSPKPAWIVDGQQRFTALCQSTDRKFSVPVTAFIADSVGIQRDQFIRVNSVKPLDKGLVTELLPEVDTVLSSRLSARKLPAELVSRLDNNPDSPFCGMIKRSSLSVADRRNRPIQDTSLARGLEENLNQVTGCLFPYRNVATGEADVDKIWWFICTYWTAVKEVFPEAWGLDPKDSRLMHSVGIRSMARLMDRVTASIDVFDPKGVEKTKIELGSIRDHCAWTNGRWDGLNGMEWNALQSTSSHIRLLSNFLVRIYVQERRSKK